MVPQRLRANLPSLTFRIEVAAQLGRWRRNAARFGDRAPLSGLRTGSAVCRCGGCGGTFSPALTSGRNRGACYRSARLPSLRVIRPMTLINAQLTATPTAPFNAPSANPPIQISAADIDGSPSASSIKDQTTPIMGINHHRDRGIKPPRNPSKIAVGINVLGPSFDYEHGSFKALP